jgi:hypothetical protein
MKSSLFFIVLIFSAANLFGQGFEKAIATAKTSYASGKLEETHFALQQAMQEVDLIIGNEVLKILPANMENMQANIAYDQVASNIGFVGATIHRSYGTSPASAELDIISNSPLIATLNTFLNTPLLGGMMSDANNKTVKVQGYKGRLTASETSEPGKKNYELMIPLGSALFTFRANNSSEAQILALANTLPIQKIAKLIQ